jgi:hypothetical protein
VQPGAWNTSDPTALAEVQGQVTDLIASLINASPCSAMYMLRLNPSNCHLEYSTDGGTTWLEVSGWDSFPSCVTAIIGETGAGNIVMSNVPFFPPTPIWIEDGSDWVYAG